MQNKNKEENISKSTLEEVYKELYMDMYLAMQESDFSNGDELYMLRRSNIYAIEFTTDVWKNQWSNR